MLKCGVAEPLTYLRLSRVEATVSRNGFSPAGESDARHCRQTDDFSRHEGGRASPPQPPESGSCEALEHRCSFAVAGCYLANGERFELQPKSGGTALRH